MRNVTHNFVGTSGVRYWIFEIDIIIIDTIITIYRDINTVTIIEISF